MHEARIDEPPRAVLPLGVERTRETYVALERAFELVDDVLPGRGDQDSDLLQQLESEGVVAIETAASDDGLNEYVRFTFERFADHVVAGAVLDDSLVDGNLPLPLSPDSPLARACGRDGLPWGVLEALAVQLLGGALQAPRGVRLPTLRRPFRRPGARPCRRPVPLCPSAAPSPLLLQPRRQEPRPRRLLQRRDISGAIVTKDFPCCSNDTRRTQPAPPRCW